jgi:hypothetical protein
VVYDPDDDSWQMLGFSSDTAFIDPMSLGDANQVVPVVTDSTYVDSTMGYAGLYHGGAAGGSATNRDAQFDNVSLDVVPEPATMSLLALGGLAGLIRRRR